MIDQFVPDLGDDVFRIVLFAFSCIGVLDLFVFYFTFLYTMVNVICRPDASTSFIAIIGSTLLYSVLRFVPVPFLVIGLRINLSMIEDYVPLVVRAAVIIAGFWLNLTITLPATLLWYSRSRYGIGNEPRADVKNKPDFIVILPVYNEELPLLSKGIQSLVDQRYPKDKITLHIAFDSDELSTLYKGTIKFLDDHANDVASEKGTSFVNTVETNHQTISGIYQGVDIYVHKWKHNGKRLCQSATYNFIKEHHDIKENNTILLLTDSDNETKDHAFHNLAANFVENPRRKAFAGYMTCFSSGALVFNIWNLLQDVEYVTGEMMRAFELLLGAINCLPGGFTALRYEVFDQKLPKENMTVAEKYFGDLPSYSVTDHHRNYLGEDRYLTHLLHQALPKYALGFCPSARAKTDPPNTWTKLVSQRRRWFLGALSNELYQISDGIIWRKLFFMNLYKVMQLAFRCNFFAQVVMILLAIQYAIESQQHGILIFTAVLPFTVNYIAACITGYKLGHHKVYLLHPFMMISSVITQVFIEYYSVWTFSQKSWGGARVGKKNKGVDAV